MGCEDDIIAQRFNAIRVMGNSGGCWGLSMKGIKGKNKNAHKANKGIVQEKGTNFLLIYRNWMIDWNSPRDTELNILKILEEYTQNRWKTMKESVKNEEMRRQSKKKLEKCKELYNV